MTKEYLKGIDRESLEFMLSNVKERLQAIEKDVPSDKLLQQANDYRYALTASTAMYDYGSLSLYAQMPGVIWKDLLTRKEEIEEALTELEEATEQEIPSFESQDEAWAWMEGEVDDPCVDNHRLTRTDSESDMANYDQKADQGCCGYFDRKVLIQGVEYMIGCNYGH